MRIASNRFRHIKTPSGLPLLLGANLFNRDFGDTRCLCKGMLREEALQNRSKTRLFLIAEAIQTSLYEACSRSVRFLGCIGSLSAKPNFHSARILRGGGLLYQSALRQPGNEPRYYRQIIRQKDLELFQRCNLRRGFQEMQNLALLHGESRSEAGGTNKSHRARQSANLAFNRVIGRMGVDTRLLVIICHAAQRAAQKILLLLIQLFYRDRGLFVSKHLISGQSVNAINSQNQRFSAAICLARRLDDVLPREEFRQAARYRAFFERHRLDKIFGTAFGTTSEERKDVTRGHTERRPERTQNTDELAVKAQK